MNREELKRYCANNSTKLNAAEKSDYDKIIKSKSWCKRLFERNQYNGIDVLVRHGLTVCECQNKYHDETEDCDCDVEDRSDRLAFMYIFASYLWSKIFRYGVESDFDYFDSYNEFGWYGMNLDSLREKLFHKISLLQYLCDIDDKYVIYSCYGDTHCLDNLPDDFEFTRGMLTSITLGDRKNQLFSVDNSPELRCKWCINCTIDDRYLGHELLKNKLNNELNTSTSVSDNVSTDESNQNIHMYKCYNCCNCYSMVHCNNCNNCKDCDHCSYSNNLLKCEYTSGCVSCTDCTSLYNSHFCNNCNDCCRLIHCKNCKKNCKFCINCDNCVNMRLSVNSENFINDSDRFWHAKICIYENNLYKLDPTQFVSAGKKLSTNNYRSIVNIGLIDSMSTMLKTFPKFIDIGLKWLNEATTIQYAYADRSSSKNKLSEEKLFKYGCVSYEPCCARTDLFKKCHVFTIHSPMVSMDSIFFELLDSNEFKDNKQSIIVDFDGHRVDFYKNYLEMSYKGVIWFKGEYGIRKDCTTFKKLFDERFFEKKFNKNVKVNYDLLLDNIYISLGYFYYKDSHEIMCKAWFNGTERFEKDEVLKRVGIDEQVLNTDKHVDSCLVNHYRKLSLIDIIEIYKHSDENLLLVISDYVSTNDCIAVDVYDKNGQYTCSKVCFEICGSGY